MAAFACGVLGFLLYFVGGFTLDVWHDVQAIPFAGTLLSIAAIVLGLVGRKRESAGRTLATTGLILGAVSVAWLVGFIVLASTGVISG